MIQLVRPPTATFRPRSYAAVAGDTIKVYPGVYNEMAVNRTPVNGGTYQFGLYIDKDNLTVQGVDAAGVAITDASNTAARITTNATNNFGYSGIFVQGNGVTLAGLKIGENLPSNNKTLEIIGDNFTLKHSHMDVPGEGDGVLYFGDFRYNTGTNTSYIKGYTIDGNLFDHGSLISVNSGAGFSGPASGRQIVNNKFVYAPGGTGLPDPVHQLRHDRAVVCLSRRRRYHHRQ